MRLETRTIKQIEANALDLEIFRVANRLGRFANDCKDDSVREFADIVDGMRHRIRKHMHPVDQVRTTAA